jgi:hypothetical protein
MKFQLLSNGNTNAKLSKNSFESYILYLAPFTQNSKGINICPNASPGCAASCLFSAGRGKFNSVKNARIRKTEWMLSDRIGFYTQLAKELTFLNSKGNKIAVRLNGTSDLDHLKMLKTFAALDWQILANIQFYDYTKVRERILKYDGTNYDLTFSMSEINQSTAFSLLHSGYRVAMVFSHVPESYKSFDVINGDISDERFLDAKNCIVGLKAKGDAKKDKSGFVVQVDEYDDAKDMIEEQENAYFDNFCQTNNI